MEIQLISKLRQLWNANGPIEVTLFRIFTLLNNENESIVLIKKYNFDINKINQILTQNVEISSNLQEILNQLIKDNNLLQKESYIIYYQLYETIDYLYDFKTAIISTKSLQSI